MPGAKNGQLWVLGLTGGIACGKSSASSFLAGLGANVIDADKLSRAVTAPGGEALPARAQTFGADMLDADGHLDRRRARAGCVFGRCQPPRAGGHNTSAGAAGHAPGAYASWRRRAQTARCWMCRCFTRRAWTYCATRYGCWPCRMRIRFSALIERDGLDEEQALRRINSQMSMEEKQARCDRVIWTNRSIQATQRELESLWQMWMKKVEKGR